MSKREHVARVLFDHLGDEDGTYPNRAFVIEEWDPAVNALLDCLMEVDEGMKRAAQDVIRRRWSMAGGGETVEEILRAALQSVRNGE